MTELLKKMTFRPKGYPRLRGDDDNPPRQIMLVLFHKQLYGVDTWFRAVNGDKSCVKLLTGESSGLFSEYEARAAHDPPQIIFNNPAMLTFPIVTRSMVPYIEKHLVHALDQTERGENEKNDYDFVKRVFDKEMNDVKTIPRIIQDSWITGVDERAKLERLMTPEEKELETWWLGNRDYLVAFARRWKRGQLTDVDIQTLRGHKDHQPFLRSLSDLLRRRYPHFRDVRQMVGRPLDKDDSKTMKKSSPVIAVARSDNFNVTTQNEFRSALIDQSGFVEAVIGNPTMPPAERQQNLLDIIKTLDLLIAQLHQYNLPEHSAEEQNRAALVSYAGRVKATARGALGAPVRRHDRQEQPEHKHVDEQAAPLPLRVVSEQPPQRQQTAVVPNESVAGMAERKRIDEEANAVFGLETTSAALPRGFAPPPQQIRVGGGVAGTPVVPRIYPTQREDATGDAKVNTDHTKELHGALDTLVEIAKKFTTAQGRVAHELIVQRVGSDEEARFKQANGTHYPSMTRTHPGVEPKSDKTPNILDGKYASATVAMDVAFDADQQYDALVRLASPYTITGGPKTTYEQAPAGVANSAGGVVRLGTDNDRWLAFRSAVLLKATSDAERAAFAQIIDQSYIDIQRMVRAYGAVTDGTRSLSVKNKKTTKASMRTISSDRPLRKLYLSR
jgi:hypothetical protein